MLDELTQKMPRKWQDSYDFLENQNLTKTNILVLQNLTSIAELMLQIFSHFAYTKEASEMSHCVPMP